MHRIAYCLLFALPAFADMNINVPFLQQAPTIDGDLSEWKDYAHNDGVWDMRRIAATSFYTLDGGAYGGHFMIYGNGDDDNTWGRMILTGPSEPIGRKSK